MELYNYKATVKRIIDGDTLVADIDLGFNHSINDKPLRFYGINCPEKTLKATRKEGLEALAYVESKLQPGDTFFIRSIKDETGKYGRPLAILLYENENGDLNNLNKELYEKGFAVLYYVDSVEELEVK